MDTPAIRREWTRFWRSLLVLVLVIGTGVAVTWGFIRSHNDQALEAEQERPLHAPLRVFVENGTTVVRVDGEVQKRSGIETATLSATPFDDQIRAYATVLDPARLIELSNGYANAKAQLQTAEAKLQMSREELDRSRILYQKPQAIPLKQLQAAEATFRVDEAALAAAQSQLRTLTATAQQEWGPVLGKSLVNGSPMATRLIERQEFLLQVTLPPGVPIPKPPTKAEIEIGKNSRTEITFVSPATRADPKIQGVSFFYIAPAESGVLPGLNVLAFLPSGTAVDGVIVPGDAVIWWQDRAWVYRRTAPETFARLRISSDRPASRGGFITTDLPSNAEIVIRGAQLLLSEEFRAQLQVGGDQK